MKTTYRIPKAIAIVVILGLGIIYNMERKHIIMETYSKISGELENVEASDTIDASENNLYIYTKSFIKSSIQQLISNI